MRVILQRVSRASVTIEGNETASIGLGMLILVGFEESDSNDDISWMANKIASLRIFADENQNMNLSLPDVNGQLLVVSQFTLHAKTKKGARPSFINAAHPTIAVPIYNNFITCLENLLPGKVKTGTFG